MRFGRNKQVKQTETGATEPACRSCSLLTTLGKKSTKPSGDTERFLKLEREDTTFGVVLVSQMFLNMMQSLTDQSLLLDIKEIVTVRSGVRAFTKFEVNRAASNAHFRNYLNGMERLLDPGRQVMEFGFAENILDDRGFPFMMFRRVVGWIMGQWVTTQGIAKRRVFGDPNGDGETALLSEGEKERLRFLNLGIWGCGCAGDLVRATTLVVWFVPLRISWGSHGYYTNGRIDKEMGWEWQALRLLIDRNWRRSLFVDPPLVVTWYQVGTVLNADSINLLEIKHAVLWSITSSALALFSNDLFRQTSYFMSHFLSRIVDEDKVGLVEDEVKVTWYLRFRWSCRHCAILKEVSRGKLPVVIIAGSWWCRCGKVQWCCGCVKEMWSWSFLIDNEKLQHEPPGGSFNTQEL